MVLHDPVVRRKYYDVTRRRIIYVREDGEDDYWDDRWQRAVAEGGKGTWRRGKYSQVVRITRRYLKPENGPILEGGCGLGGKVANLSCNDFACIGIDNAKRTVDYVRAMCPAIDVRWGDVERLEFPDEYFAGYWSLGVIEHFYDGYMRCAREMHRVLIPGGYLFLEFPFMNMLRRMKSRLKLYDVLAGTRDVQFYQYALVEEEVRENYEALGFALVGRLRNGVIYGLMDEIPLLRSPMCRISRIFKKGRFSLAVSFVMNHIVDFVFGGFAGHTALMVFRKGERPIHVADQCRCEAVRVHES